MMMFLNIHKGEESLIDPEATKGPTIAWTSQIPCLKGETPLHPSLNLHAIITKLKTL